MHISIKDDFTDNPGDMYRRHGEFSGEQFREDLLVPALRLATKHDPLVVDISDVEGYNAAFLEEAFGGLVFHHQYSKETLHERLRIEAKRGFNVYKRIIWKYIDGELERRFHSE